MRRSRNQEYFLASISPYTNRCLGKEAVNRRSVLNKMDNALATRIVATAAVFLCTSVFALAVTYSMALFARGVSGLY